MHTRFKRLETRNEAILIIMRPSIPLRLSSAAAGNYVGGLQVSVWAAAGAPRADFELTAVRQPISSVEAVTTLYARIHWWLTYFPNARVADNVGGL